MISAVRVLDLPQIIARNHLKLLITRAPFRVAVKDARLEAAQLSRISTTVPQCRSRLLRFRLAQPPRSSEVGLQRTSRS